MPVLDATVAGAASNSYATVAEADVYFDARLPLPTPWPIPAGDNKIRALITATRVLDAYARPFKTFIEGDPPYYRVRRQWTGTPATITQRLAWPRIGMLDSNANAIPENVIPRELKEAQSELAGQLLMADTTLDNSVITAGIKSVSAGSVSVSFKDMIDRHVLPDMVWNLMPPWWFTAEGIAYADSFEFDMVSE